MSKQAIWNGNYYPVEQVKQYMRQQLQREQNTVDGQSLWAEVKQELSQRLRIAQKSHLSLSRTPHSPHHHKQGRNNRE